MGFEADELEALEAVFEDAVCVQGDTVTLTASARTAGREEKQFVAAVVVFRVPEAYPETSPDIQLRNVVGLDDRRQAEMLSYLVGLRQDLVGDCMLGPLCEAALEWLSDNNWPDGDCGFCLESLSAVEAPDSHAGRNGGDLVKLTCNHCFHWECFSRWWVWRQGESKTEEHRMLQERGGDTELVRQQLKSQLPEKDPGGVYAVFCPTCRIRADHAAIKPWSALLHRCLAAERKDAGGGCGAGSGRENTAVSQISGCLPKDVLDKVRETQRDFAERLRVQGAADGIINASKRLAVPEAKTASPSQPEDEGPQQHQGSSNRTMSQPHHVGAGRGGGAGRRQHHQGRPQSARPGRNGGGGGDCRNGGRGSSGGGASAGLASEADDKAAPGGAEGLGERLSGRRRAASGRARQGGGGNGREKGQHQAAAFAVTIAAAPPREPSSHGKPTPRAQSAKDGGEAATSRHGQAGSSTGTDSTVGGSKGGGGCSSQHNPSTRGGRSSRGGQRGRGAGRGGRGRGAGSSSQSSGVTTGVAEGGETKPSNTVARQ